jgi:hypothetical protein
MPLPVSDLVGGSIAPPLSILLVQVMDLSDLSPQAHDFFLEDSQMIHRVRIYQGSRTGGRYELATGGTTGLTLAARSCSLLKVDPQVLQRHPVIGVRAAFATFIREGLKDKANSPPHCKHKCLGKRPLFWGQR